MNIQDAMKAVNLDRRYRGVFHTTTMLEGCESMEGIADSLEAAAKWFRELAEEGVEVLELMDNGAVVMVTSNPDAAERYDFR